MSAHLLPVDDDAVTAGMLGFLVGDSGYRTTILADPRRVGGFLKENAIDLMLPYIDGFAFCTSLCRAHPGVPVIFLSARSAVADQVAGLRGAPTTTSPPRIPGQIGRPR